jgi:uncharacterized protein
MAITFMGIKDILELKTIAVVGLSRSEEKDSNDVARYMKEHGYRIVPVNPSSDEILGEKCYPSLIDIPYELKREIDIVDVFRPSEDCLDIAKQAVEMKKDYGKPLVFWMQLGIENEEARRILEEADIAVIENKCIKVEHQRLL